MMFIDAVGAVTRGFRILLQSRMSRIAAAVCTLTLLSSTYASAQSFTAGGTPVAIPDPGSASVTIPVSGVIAPPHRDCA